LRAYPYIYFFTNAGKSGFFLCLISLLLLSSCNLFKNRNNHHPPISKEKSYLNTGIFIEATKEKILGNYQEALNLYALCLKNDPDNAAVYYEIAGIYYSNNQLNDALIYAKKAAETDKDNFWFQLLYARLLHHNKKGDEAYHIYHKLIRKYPAHIDLLYELAIVYNDNGKYQESIDMYNKIEKLRGVQEELSVAKYKLYIELKKSEKALLELNMLIMAYPDEAEYYGMLADYYMQLNKPDEAFEVYSKILTIEPDNALIRLSLSNYYLSTGDSVKYFENLKMAFANSSLDIDSKVKILFNYYLVTEKQIHLKEKAFELAEILVNTHPDEPKSHSIYADFLYRDNKFSEAKEEFLIVLSLDSSRYIVWEQLIFCLAELRDYKAISELSKRGLELFPEQPILYLMNGMANYHLANYHAATQILTEGIFYVVNNMLLKSEFYSCMGDAYYKLNKYDSSDFAYENALKANQNNVEVLNNYSYYIALSNENLDKAETMAKKANMLKPGNASYLDTYAWVLYKKGKYGDAKIKIDEALKINGYTNATLLEHKGDIEYKLGNTEEAYTFWLKALSAGKGSELLEKKIKERKLLE